MEELTLQATVSKFDAYYKLLITQILVRESYGRFDGSCTVLLYEDWLDYTV